jgi:WD40 repeat protein
MVDDVTNPDGVPDPDLIVTAADFTRELQALRDRSGLTIREVARAAGVPLSTTGDYFSGRHLPLDREQFAAVLAALGETGQARVQRWQLALARARRLPGRRGEAPYRGLARFEASDAKWFFGREDVTGQLATLAAMPSELPLLVIGPSGAGKSSVLRAGLVPRLNDWGGTATVVDLTKTGVAELSGLVASLLTPADTVPADTVRADVAAGGAGLGRGHRGGDWRTALIIDQFEAVFTDCDDDDDRNRLIGALCELAKTELVVLALRADFYEQAIRYPGLLQALRERHVVLGPMTAEQVRRAVVEPARLARADVEEGLVGLLLADLGPHGATDTDGHGANGHNDNRPNHGGPNHGGPSQGRTGRDGKAGDAYEPGVLPLLSHAMLATWEHSRGGTLSVADYLASGGIRDALTRTAELAYESLNADERLLARRLFLRLVHVAADARPSRASVALGELPGWGRNTGEPVADTGAGTLADAERVLGTFVDERMITVSADAAQITHDALLTGWPRLRSWIAESTAELLDRGRIVDGARAWAEAGREDAALWRGSRLSLAREWAADPGMRSALTGQARAFVDASVKAGTASERAARRRTRVLQATVAVLSALVLAVAGMTGYAFSQRSAARSAQATAEHDARSAMATANMANSRDVAFTADQIRKTDPAVAAQLSVGAYRLARTPQATASLLESSGASRVARFDDSAGIVQWVTVSPDHRLLAAAGDDGTLRLWNVAAPGQPTVVTTLVNASSQPMYAAAFSPDGKLLAAAGDDRVVTLWRISGTTAVRLATTLAGPAGTVYSVAFSPDSTTLAAASSDATVRLWHVADPAHPAADGIPLVLPAGTEPNSVAFSPDGSALATGTTGQAVWLWHLPTAADLAAGTAPALFSGMPLTGPAGSVSGVAFSPDGGELAAASKDFKVWLWRVSATGATPDGALTGSANWVNTLAFSPDGQSLAAGTSSANVLVWNLTTRTISARLPHPLPVTSVTWDGPGRIAAGGADGTVSFWSLPASVLATAGSPTNVAYGPDGTTLAVGASDVQLWNTLSGALLASYPLAAHEFTNATVFRPKAAGAPLIAVALSDGTVALLDGRTLASVTAPFLVTAGARAAAESVAFSPNGRLLATGADDGTVRLFDVTDPAHPRQLASARGAGSAAPIYTVVFAPDGATIAASSISNVVQLWRVTGRDGLVSAGPNLGGMASYPIGLAFTPDSKTLAIGNADKHVYLWNVADPARPRRLGKPLSGPSGNVWAIAISPDGKTLAGGANDGSVWLWNLADPARPALVATLNGLPGHVFSVAFNPGGGQLAAASYEDDTVRLWDTQPAAAWAGICANLGQPLSATEWANYVPGVPYHAPCS